MSFFDLPGLPPKGRVQEEPALPEWMDPPRGVLPGVSTQRPVVFTTDRAFLMVERVLVYPNAIELTFQVRLRHRADYSDDLLRQFLEPSRPGPLPDETLRLGLLLSDGTRCTNLDWKPVRPDRVPEPPVMMIRESGGIREAGAIGGAHYMRYWVWPLPPPGPLGVVAEWPAFDVSEVRVDIDATELRARAAAAEVVWPD